MRSDIPVRVHVGGVEEDEDVLTAHPQRSWVDANTRDVHCTVYTNTTVCETLSQSLALSFSSYIKQCNNANKSSPKTSGITV